MAEATVRDDRPRRSANQVAFYSERAKRVHELGTHGIQLTLAEVDIPRWWGREQIRGRKIVVRVRLRLLRCIELRGNFANVRRGDRSLQLAR